MAARRLALALVAGLLLFAGHPPIAVGMAGLVAVVPLLALSADLRRAGERARDAFGWGLLAGLVAFAPLLDWIGRFGVAAWLLLTLLQAAFIGVFVLVAAAWRRPYALTAAVLLWGGVEAARARAPLGGFTWGLLGYTQADGGLFLPAARTVGVLGVGLLCAGVGAALYGAGATLWRSRRELGVAGLGEQGFRAARGPLTALTVLLVGGVLLGVDAPPESAGRVDIAAIQGNDLVETADLGGRRVAEVARRVVSLTREFAREAGEDLPDVVVWPENSLDDDVRSDAALRRIVAPALRTLDGTPVLAGMLGDGPRPRTFLNTVSRLALDERGRVVVEREYVKRKVVPFGEYVPGRRFLEWIPALDQIPSDALPGTATTLFEVGDARIGAIICFENIFPVLSYDMVRAGANVLVVSTNNASYGFSAASEQHLAFSRLRAVETGRWVLHAGISGISAVVDPDGDVSQVTGLFERAVVRAELPLVEGLTPAVRLGPWLERLMLLLAALICLVAAWDAWRRRGQMAVGGGDGYAAPQAPVI